MNTFDRILFPIDFSPAITAMIPSVIEMAHRFDATVTVLNAFNLVNEYSLAPNIECLGDADPDPVPYSPSLQELRDQRKQRVEDFAQAQLSDIRYSTRIQDGDPALVIQWVVQRENTDLLMMPTKGMGRFRRLFLGSVTAKVLHDVKCPVFTSAHHPDPAKTSSVGFRSIVCAVDLNSEAESIFTSAALIARIYEARVCLLHVDPSAGEMGEPPTALELRHSFDHALSVNNSGTADDVNLCVLNSTVPEGIRQIAIEEKADLVVVGRGRARGTFAQVWSPLYRIVRESPCPVLSV